MAITLQGGGGSLHAVQPFFEHTQSKLSYQQFSRIRCRRHIEAAACFVFLSNSLHLITYISFMGGLPDPNMLF